MESFPFTSGMVVALGSPGVGEFGAGAGVAAPLEKLTVIVSPEETLEPAAGLEETALPRSTSLETSLPFLNCRPASQARKV